MVRATRAALLTLYFIVFVDFLQISFIFPLLPKIVESFGKGPTELGILGSVAALAEGIAAPYLGSLADRIGRRPVFIVAMLGCILSSVLIGFASTWELLIVARLATGICGGTGSVAAAYIADVTTEEERPDYMTYYQAAIFLGLSGGPSVSGYMTSVGGFPLACFTAAGICAVNLLCVIFLLPESSAWRASSGSTTGDGCSSTQPADGEPARSSTRLPCAAYTIGGAFFLNGVGFTALETLGILFAQDEFFGGEPDPATLFCSRLLSCLGVVGLVVNLVLYSPLQRSAGLKGSIFLGGILAAASFVGMGVPLSKEWFFAVCQVFVFGDNILGTSTQTMITFVVEPHQFGKALGMMTLCGNVARACGPFVFAPIYEHISQTLPWFVNAVCKVFVIVLCASVRLRDSSSAEQPLAAAPADEERPAAMVRALTRQTSGAFRASGGGAEALVRGLAAGRTAIGPTLLTRSFSWAHTEAQPPCLQAAGRATTTSG
mmetsp:Transcript_39858/g.115306  ORF Transcript_39858/g.115306 Transcript_39858/m.115306 type:complete len:490 (+) Transcript_39858:50-1519(+)